MTCHSTRNWRDQKPSDATEAPTSPLEDPRYWAAHEQVRFVVERRPKSWLWKRWQVRPETATGVFFEGTRYQCLRYQQYLHMAARNGAWVALTHKCC